MILFTYVNGRMEKSPKISVFDEGLLYGWGVYETLRAYSGVAFRLDEHAARLEASALQIGLDFPGKSEVASAVRKTIEANTLTDAALRAVLTAGGNSTWGKADPSLIVMAKKLDPVKPAFRAVSVRFHRDVANAKTLNCLTSVLARRHALAHGVDEAIFTFDGNALEGTSSNLFALYGNELITPKKKVLGGITRSVVMQNAKEAGLKVKEEELPLEKLYRCDEAFFTSTLKQVVPLVEVDGKPIRAGPVTGKLKAGFQKRVQDEIAFARKNP